MFPVREISLFGGNISCDCKIFYPMEMSLSAPVLFEVVPARGQPELTSKALYTSHSTIAMGLAPGSGQTTLAHSRKSPFYHSGVPYHCGCGQVNLIFLEHQSLFICEMDFFYKISVFQPFCPPFLRTIQEKTSNNNFQGFGFFFLTTVYIQGNFSCKDGTIKNRDGKDLIEAVEIKKRWQEYTEELYKKSLNDR